MFQLLDIYMPSSPGQREEVWGDALRGLAANNFERLRSFDHQAEREFLSDLRAFVFEQGATKLDLSKEVSCVPRPTPETVTTFLKGLPFLHQEILFFKLAGYSDATLERVSRIAPGVAQKGLKRLPDEYRIVLDRDRDECVWPAAWLELLRQARASRKDECPAVRQFVRILDGQVSWYDKEPVEKHTAECLHCLEGWTALREIHFWRGEVKPCPSAQVESLLSALPIQPEAKCKARKSFFKRIFGEIRSS